ncbi:MAG: hypothetical protein KDH96_02725, partial [Candidatus Riesia sp.]|nr:hypothetical protein [Candidatus Riesia sp.]
MASKNQWIPDNYFEQQLFTNIRFVLSSTISVTNASIGEMLLVNPDTVPVTVNLPDITTNSGPGLYSAQEIMVIDYDGTADVNAITINYPAYAGGSSEIIDVRTGTKVSSVTIDNKFSSYILVPVSTYWYAYYITSTGVVGGSFLPLAGGTMTGDIDMGANNITNVDRINSNLTFVPTLAAQYVISPTLETNILLFQDLSNQSIKLPDATLLPVGWNVHIICDKFSASSRSISRLFNGNDVVIASGFKPPIELGVTLLDNSLIGGRWGVSLNDAYNQSPLPGFGFTNDYPGIDDEILTANTQLLVGTNYYANTSGGSFSVTLPDQDKFFGTRILIRDYADTWATNPLTVIPPAGDTIFGDAGLQIINHDYGSLIFTYNSLTSDWSVENSLMIGSTGVTKGIQGLVPPSAAGEQDYVLTAEGSWSRVPYTRVQELSGPATIETQTLYAINTSGGALALTVPDGGALIASRIYFFDRTGSFAANNLTLNTSGANLFRNVDSGATAASLVLDKNNLHVELIYADTDRWDYSIKADVSGYLPLTGGTMTGAINMGAQQINNLAAPTAGTDAVTLTYAENTYVNVAGDVMTGDLDMNSNKVLQAARVNRQMENKGALVAQDNLTVDSKQIQYYSDVAGFNIRMPDAATLPVGWQVTVLVQDNTSTESTVQGFTGAALMSLFEGKSRAGTFTLLDNGSSAGVWSANVDTFEETFGASLTPTVLAGPSTLNPGYDYYVDTSGGSFTATLPSGQETGTFVVVRDETGSWDTNPLTVAPAAATVQGNANIVLDHRYGNVTFVYNATAADWYVDNARMIGATVSLPGRAGLVPQPAAAQHRSVLLGDSSFSLMPVTKYLSVTAAATAEMSTLHAVNTTGAPFTLTIPDGGSNFGATIKVQDVAGTLSINNLTIARSGSNLFRGFPNTSTSTSVVLSTNYTNITFVYTSTNIWTYFVNGNISAYLPLAGGTMTGVLNMGSNLISAVTDPVAAQDAATKNYVDTTDNLRVLKAGDTMSGVLNMGSNLISAVTDPVGAQDAATKNYVDTADNLRVLKAGDTMSGVLNMGSNLISSVSDPVSAQDAATKFYVDSLSSGLSLKEPVRVVTRVALPAYTQAGAGIGATLTADVNGALPAIDGVSLSVSDRVLVISLGSATPDDNGIYTVTQLGDGSNPWILTRATDFDEDTTEVIYGSFVFVQEGTECTGCGYVLTGSGAITMDTTALNFTQFSSPGSFVQKTGDTMSGALDMGTTNKITNLAEPTAAQDAATMNYVDTADNLRVLKAGDTMTGNLNMSGTNTVVSAANPTNPQDVSTKAYTDAADAFSLQAFSVITADPAPAVTRTKYLADTSGGAFAVTMPAGSVAGEWIEFVDYARSFGTNSLTLNAAGADMFYLAGISVGLASLVLDMDDYHVRVTYTEANTWMIEIVNPSVIEGPSYSITADPAPAEKNSKYMADSSGGAFNFTLPDSTTVPLGSVVEVFDATSSFATNNVTVQRSGTDLIYVPDAAGATSLVLSLNNDSRRFVRVASQRWVVSAGASSGGSTLTISDVSADPLPAVVDTEYHVDTSGGSFSFTMPSAPADGAHIRIIDSTNSFAVNPLSVVSAGADTFSGSLGLVINTGNQVADLYYHAAETDWKVALGITTQYVPTTLHMARVQKSTGQDILSSVYAKLNYTTVLLDVGGIATTGVDPITIVQDGTYRISGSVQVGQNVITQPDPQMYIAIHVNNVVFDTREYRLTGGDLVGGTNIRLDGNLYFDVIVELSAGDAIDIRARRNPLGADTLNVLESCLNIQQLPLYSISNLVNLEYVYITNSSNAVQAATSDIVFDGVQVSSGSAAQYNSGTGVLTLAPFRTYEIETFLKFDAFTSATDQLTVAFTDLVNVIMPNTPQGLFRPLTYTTDSSNAGTLKFIIYGGLSPQTMKLYVTAAVGSATFVGAESYLSVKVIGGSTDVTAMTGATNVADGVGGTVPAPLTGDQNAVLVGDATWSRVPVTKTAAISADPAPAVIGTRYACDTSGAAFSVTLPDSASTTIGTVVEVFDAKQSFATNNLTVQRSGSDMIYESGQSAVTSVVLSENNSHRRFILGESLKWFVEAAGTGSGGGVSSVSISADPAPGVVSTRYFADTSGGAFTFTLPLGTAVGEQIEIFDGASSFNVNNLTVQTTGGDQLIYPRSNTPVASIVLPCHDTHIIFTYVATNLWGVEYISPSESEGVALAATADPAPAIKNARYMCNTSGGAFTVTLPDIAASYLRLGDTVEVFDAASSFSTNNLTVQCSGADLIYISAGVASASYVLSRNDDNRKFVYVAANRWEVKGGAGSSLARTNITVDPAPAVVETEYHADTSGGAFNLTLPTAPADGSHIRILDAFNQFSTNNLTVLPGGADTITGGTILVLSGYGQVVDLFYDSGATDWKVADHQVPAPIKLHKGKITRATQSIPASTNTDISFDTIVSNIGNIASVPSTTPITIAQDGYYNITANGTYLSGDPSTNAYFRVITSGSGIVTYDNENAITSGFGKAFSCSVNLPLIIGETIRVEVFHNSAGATAFGSLELSVVQLADSVLTNVAQALEYSTASRVALQTTNITLGEPVRFDTILSEVGSSATYDTGTVAWTLLAGKSYHLQASVVRVNFSASTGELTLQWRDQTGATDLGVALAVNASSHAIDAAFAGTAEAYFSPLVDSQVQLVIKKVVSLTSIGDANSGSNGGVVGSVEVLSDNSRVTSMIGATTSTAGLQGLVPTPGAGLQDAVLTGDATWSPIPVVRQVALASSLTPAVPSTRYVIDTTGAPRTMWLPDSSTVPVGSIIEIVDAKQTFDINTLTVNRSGTDLIYQLDKVGATSLVFDRINSFARFVLSESLKWVVESVDLDTLVIDDITADPAPAVISTFYHADTSGGAFTITLPTAPVDGSHIRIMDSTGSFDSNNLTVTRGGSDTIEGGTSVVYSTKYSVVDLFYHAANTTWVVAQHEVPTPIVLNRGENVLSSTVNVFTVSPQTVLEVTLPVAGTYAVTADCVGVINNNGTTHRFIICDLYNVTDAAVVVNSETVVTSVEYDIGGASIQSRGGSSIHSVITVTDSKVIRLRGYVNDAGGGTTQADMLGGVQGRTKLRYDQLPAAVISNVQETTNHSFAVAPVQQTTDLVVNSPLKFTSLASEVGTSAAYNVGTFTWTLLANKTYFLVSSVARADFSATNAELTYQWRDITGGADLGSSAAIASHTFTSDVGWGGTAVAVFTPSVDSDVQVVFKKITSVTSVGGSNSGTNGMSGYVVVLNDPAGSAVMAGATNVSNGATGKVPQPLAGEQNSVLKGDATWSALPVTEYLAISADPATAQVGVRYACDTSGGAFSLTLPDTASFPVGSAVEVMDAKQTFDTNNLTVQAAGSDMIYEVGSNAVASVVLVEKNAHRRFIIAESLKWMVEAAGSGGGGLTVVNISADPAPAVVGTTYHVDSSGGAFNITLPATPNDGDQVQIVDVTGSFNINPVNVLRGILTDTIEGYAQITLNTAYLICDLIYDSDNAVWVVRYSDNPSPVRLSYLKAIKTTSQSIPDSTFTNVAPYETISFDTEGAFTGATGTFVAPRTAKYSVQANAMFTTTTSHPVQYIIGISINGASPLERDLFVVHNSTALAAFPNPSINTTIDLVANDTVNIRVFQNSGVAQNLLADSNFSRLIIKEEPVYSVVNAVLPMEYMLATGVGTQDNINANDRVNFTTVSSSAGTSITLSGGIFTLLQGKTYRLRGASRIFSPSNSNVVLQWYNITAAATTGIGATILTVDSTASSSSSTMAETIITPAITTQVELRVLSVSTPGVIDLHLDRSFADIETIADTTRVTSFVGATATVNGLPGIVPQPLAGDQKKVVLGDGTWGFRYTRGVKYFPNENRGYENHGFGFISTDDLLITHGYGVGGLNMNSRRPNGTAWLPNVHSTATRKTGEWAGLFQGYYYLFAWTSTGEIWGGGRNDHGILATGNTASKYILEHRNNGVGPQNVINVLATESDNVGVTVYALTSTGEVWAVGYNAYGQVVNGTTTSPVTSWNQITGYTGNAIQIASNLAQFATIFIVTDQPTNNLWAAGHNVAGQIGDGSTTNKTSLVNIAENVDYVQTFFMDGGSQAFGHTTILTKTGTIKSTGRNSNGEIGDGTTVGKTVFTQEALGKTDWVSFGGTSAGSGGSRRAIDAGGNLYTWGYNSLGQLGLGDTTQRTQPTLVTQPWSGNIKYIRAAPNYTGAGFLVITDDGEAWYAGIGGNYQVARADLSTGNQNTFSLL